MKASQPEDLVMPERPELSQGEYNYWVSEYTTARWMAKPDAEAQAHADRMLARRLRLIKREREV